MEVLIFPNEGDHSHCPVAMFYKYHCKLLINRKCSAFYLQPRTVFAEDAWYMDALIGINKLRNTIKDMTCKAGIEGHFTNHSLCFTSATRMYQVGIEE